MTRMEIHCTGVM